MVLAARAARHTSRDNRQARRLVSAANSASENDDDDDTTCSDANVLQHGNIVDALSSSQVRLQELRHQDLHDATLFNVRLQGYITCILDC